MKPASEGRSRDEIEDLLDAADGLPYGPGQIAMCEEAVAAADSLGDPHFAYWARQKLVDASMFGGQPKLTLVAFTWCVAQYDRDPDSHDSYDLLWRFKWIVTTITRFPEIDRVTIEKMLQDMERRFLASGTSMQPVWHKRRRVALNLGDLDAAAAAHRQCVKATRSFLSDCHACEINALAEYYFALGKNALGLKKTERIFDGSMGCAEIPHATHAEVLLPLLKSGQAEDAMGHHRVGYPMIKTNPEFNRAHAQHIAFLGLTGNDARALKLLEKHLPEAIDGSDPDREFEFLRHAWLGVASIADRKKRVKMRLPMLTDKLSGDGEFGLADLANALEKRALAVAGRFDQRNGNDHYTQLVRDMPAWKRYAVQLPYKSR